MELTKIMKTINDRLAGETITFTEMVTHLDAVVDEINQTLSSKFPVFSEFNNTDHAQYPNYNFFPDKYIRTVVCTGAAAKFYITDEEGQESAKEYKYEYQNNLFAMLRDYATNIPEEYQDFEQGFVVSSKYDDIELRGLE